VSGLFSFCRPANYLLISLGGQVQPKSRRWINHETHEKKSNRGSSGVWLVFTRQVKSLGRKKSSGFRVISPISWFQSRFVGSMGSSNHFV
jgi:hypothetical protein